AAATRRIGLAATLSTTFYPPFLLARLMTTLDHLSRGRIAWNVVTSYKVEQLLVPEVQGLLDLVGRHHVPRDAPSAQVVERRHEAGEQEWRIERRRQRGRKADAARHRRHDGDEGTRIVKGRVLGVA